MTTIDRYLVVLELEKQITTLRKEFETHLERKLVTKLLADCLW